MPLYGKYRTLHELNLYSRQIQVIEESHQLNGKHVKFNDNNLYDKVLNKTTHGLMQNNISIELRTDEILENINVLHKMRLINLKNQT